MGCPSRTITGLSPWDPLGWRRVPKLGCQVSLKLSQKKIYLDGNEAQSGLERSLIGALSVTDNLQNISRKVTTYFRYGTDT